MVNRHETTKVMLGHEVLRVAGCDISLFDECLYFRPYASINSYHKEIIPFLEGDKALRATCCKILSAQSTTMVNTYTGLAIESTIDSFTERSVHSAAFAHKPA